MKSRKLFAVLLAAGVSTAAMAQTMDSSTTNASNSATSQTGASDSMGGMSGNTSATGMNGSMPSSNAQPLPDTGSAPNRPNSDFGTLSPGTADTQPGVNPPSTTRAANSTETRAPLKGANSFTQHQAMRKLEKAGYTQVTGLAKDDQSVWRAKAMKGGESVSVALDYRGHITDQPAQE